jgi:hypothetical protein
MRKLVVLLVCFVVLTALSIPVHGQTEESFRFTVHASSPAKIVVMCAYTQNITNPAVITVNNQSGFQFQINTAGHMTVITFGTGDMDTFQFGFTVYYPVGVSQLVEVDVIQGSSQTETSAEQLPVFGTSFSMSFTLITAMEQHYPTAEELINTILGNYPTMQNFNDWISLQKGQLDMLNSNQTWQWIMLLAILALLVAFEVISKWPQLRRASKEES